MRSAEQQSPFATALVLAVFFLSGVAALLYQVIWQRMLALFSGADVFSVTIVVAAFMGGLGCGNFVGGHWADRLSRMRCLVLFALAELAISAFALASKLLYYDVLYQRLGATAIPLPAMAVVLFLGVVWPTFFMGISLPLLARALTPALEAAARTVGSLYGWNTLGAAVGAFGTTWLLLRHFDFETCLRIGAALNFLCAVAVIPLRRRLNLGAPVLEAPSIEAPGVGMPVVEARREAVVRSVRPRAPIFGVPAWLFLYGLSGAVALSLEIAWFRVLDVMLKSTSFTFGTLLSFFLFGVGSGSIVGSWLVRRSAAQPAQRFLALQSCIPIYAAFSLALLVALVEPDRTLGVLWQYFAGVEPMPLQAILAALRHDPFGYLTSSLALGEIVRLFLGTHFLLPLVLIGPPTFLMGLSFPYLQRAVQTEARFLGRRVGWLQTANIAGSLLGSLLTGFVLLPRIGSAGTFLLLALLSLAYVALWMRVSSRPGLPYAPLAVGAAALLSALVLPNGNQLWATLHGARPEHVQVAEDAAGVSLLRPDALRRMMVMAGGVQISEIPYGTYGGIHTLLGVVPVLLHPEPRRVGLIGLGSGDTSFAAGARAVVEEVVTIEIMGSQFDVLRAFQARRPYPGLTILFSDPRFQFVVGDGRTFLRRDPRKYDVIEADALQPTSAYSGNLYSLEYFALLRASLNPGGLAVTWVPTRRVRDTFVRSFPHVLILGEIAIGSEASIPFDREALLEACRAEDVRAHFEPVGIELCGLVQRQLTLRPPVEIGPDADRAQLDDVNSDLFAKDEFLIDVRRYGGG
jgi:spermidine synthase